MFSPDSESDRFVKSTATNYQAVSGRAVLL